MIFVQNVFVCPLSTGKTLTYDTKVSDRHLHLQTETLANLYRCDGVTYLSHENNEGREIDACVCVERSEVDYKSITIYTTLAVNFIVVAIVGLIYIRQKRYSSQSFNQAESNRTTTRI